MTQIGRSILFSILMCLSSCGPSSLEEIRIQAEAETQKLACELRGIEKKEDLEKALPYLKKRFSQLTDLLVAIREYPVEDIEPTLASEELFIELARIYEIPGAKTLVGIAQADAARRLEVH